MKVDMPERMAPSPALRAAVRGGTRTRTCRFSTVGGRWRSPRSLASVPISSSTRSRVLRVAGELPMQMRTRSTRINAHPNRLGKREAAMLTSALPVAGGHEAIGLPQAAPSQHDPAQSPGGHTYTPCRALSAETGQDRAFLLFERHCRAVARRCDRDETQCIRATTDS